MGDGTEVTPTQTLIAWLSAGMSIAIVAIVTVLYLIILLSVYTKRDRKERRNAPHNSLNT